MTRLAGLVLVLACVACGASPHDHGGHAGDDGGAADGGTDGGEGSGSGTGSGSGSGSGSGNGSGSGSSTDPIPLTACGSQVELDTTLATALDMTSLTTFQPAPWLLTDARARVLYTSTSQIMTAAHGSATTTVQAILAGASYAYGERSITGDTAIIFASGSQVMASINFTTPIAIPCTFGDATSNECDVRAAGDHHLWVRSGTHLYEQTGTTFADRGGAPIYPSLFAVAANNDITVASESSIGDDVFVIWTLVHDSGGWTKTGALTKTILGAQASAIEGGFHLDPAIGAIAPDGSFHLLSSSRCIGTGQRNKTQLYMRSRDGVTWDIETLPDIGTFTDNQVTWKDAAVWASDYDNVRFVNESSPTPTDNGDGTYGYPDRQYNAIARCTNNGTPGFERYAKVRLPGWTVRGVAGFSETGVVTFATTLGLTQAYR